jgi:hydroxyacylglutathione hydrolase
MFTSLGRLAGLPDETRLYCAHEYTLSNALFAAHAEPGNSQISERLAAVEKLRSQRKITVPTTVAAERATNPFVRSGDWQEFARLRAEKDSFRS